MSTSAAYVESSQRCSYYKEKCVFLLKSSHFSFFFPLSNSARFRRKVVKVKFVIGCWHLDLEKIALVEVKSMYLLQKNCGMQYKRKSNLKKQLSSPAKFHHFIDFHDFPFSSIPVYILFKDAWKRNLRRLITPIL